MTHIIVPMRTIQVSVTLDAKRVAEAKRRVGDRGFSRYLDEALAVALQHDRLAELEAELEAEFGPIPDDVRGRIEAMEWPT